MMLLTLLVLSFAALVEPYRNYGCYGDLRTIDIPMITCGNAIQTTDCGVPAIQRMAQTDLVYLRRYEVPIRNVARNLCVEPAMIAALISGESRAGSILVDGWNRGRSRYGLMQIHSRYYPIMGAWNSEENINQGMTILTTNIRLLRRRFPNWTWQQYWRAAAFCLVSLPSGDYSVNSRSFRFQEELPTAETLAGMLRSVHSPCDTNNYTTGRDQMQRAIMAGFIFVLTCAVSCLAMQSDAGLFLGVAASETIAERDLKNLEKYKASIEKVGKETNMDAAVIAGIMSRESHAGTTLKDGWGDKGNGFGLMQVDKRFHTPTGKWNSEEHMTQGTQILLNHIKDIQNKFPQWTKEQQLKGGISAYNAGTKNVRTYEKMDIGTTKNDYANDVVARAKFYKSHGY